MIYKKGKSHSSIEIFVFFFSFLVRITFAVLLLTCIYADGNVVVFLGLKKISLSLFCFKTTIAMNRK